MSSAFERPYRHLRPHQNLTSWLGREGDARLQTYPDCQDATKYVGQGVGEDETCHLREVDAKGETFADLVVFGHTLRILETNLLGVITGPNVQVKLIREPLNCEFGKLHPSVRCEDVEKSTGA